MGFETAFYDEVMREQVTGRRADQIFWLLHRRNRIPPIGNFEPLSERDRANWQRVEKQRQSPTLSTFFMIQGEGEAHVPRFQRTVL